jgi:multicomponent Na+:H+ antiporter subunit C
MGAIFAIVTGILFGLGVFQLLRRDLIKVAMGFFILFTAINLFLLAVGTFDGQVAPYVQPGTFERLEDAVPGGTPSDPLVQALILTAIVISFGSYALLLGMLNVVGKRNTSINADDLNDLKG